MKFWKENSYDIVRLLINQLGITVFSLMLYFTSSTVASKNPDLASTLQILISVFSTLFYFALLYCAAWDYGAKDRIRVDAKRISHMPWKGLFLSLCANVPNLVLAALGLIGKSVYMLSGSEFLDGVFAFSNLILRFIAAMYLGIVQAPFSSLSATNSDLSFLLQSVLFLILPLFAVGATQFGYRMGDLGKKLFSAWQQTEKKNR